MPPFRQAAAADIPAIVALVNRAYLIEQFCVAGDRTDAAEIARMLEDGTILLAERDGAPIGCVYVALQRDHGYFGLLSVDPTAQGQGLGRALIDAAEAWCRAAGCREIRIRTIDVRTELPPFYRRLGYAEIGITEPFPLPAKARMPLQFVIMSKALA